jgi:hypothetical protein
MQYLIMMNNCNNMQRIIIVINTAFLSLKTPMDDNYNISSIKTHCSVDSVQRRPGYLIIYRND